MSADGIQNKPTGIRVSIEASRARQTPKTDFGSVMKTGISRSADAVLSAGRLAAPFIPGGAIVSAAVTGMGELKSSASGRTASNGTSMGGQVAGSGYSSASGLGGGGGTVSGSGATGAVAASAQGGDSQAQLFMATREMQEMNQSFNLQYLMLQQKMQGENRQFTLMSNIMKTKHDTAKNAINNVR